MRVLITGANGFAGRHVIKHLLQYTDWKLIAVDRTQSSRPHLRVDQFVFDLRDQPLPNQFGNIDVVIHLAASSDVPSFITEPQKHILNNVTGTVNLLQWSLYQDLQMFIQVSTNEVYGSTTVISSKEWDPLIPATPYSASKAAQEMMAIAWHQTFGVPSVIVNTSHLFGEWQPENKFIPTIIRNTLASKSVPIYARDFNSQWEASIRNWTYAGDFADALRWIIEKGAINGYVDRWNVAGPTRNCFSVAEQVAKLLNLPLSVEWQNSQEARPGYEHQYTLDTTMITRHGFLPRCGFDEGLSRTVHWFKEKLQK